MTSLNSSTLRSLQTLYKTQLKELKEDLSEKSKSYNELEIEFKSLESERNALQGQLQFAIAKADSEQVARCVLAFQTSPTFH